MKRSTGMKHGYVLMLLVVSVCKVPASLHVQCRVRDIAGGRRGRVVIDVQCHDIVYMYGTIDVMTLYGTLGGPAVYRTCTGAVCTCKQACAACVASCHRAGRLRCARDVMSSKLGVLTASDAATGRDRGLVSTVLYSTSDYRYSV